MDGCLCGWANVGGTCPSLAFIKCGDMGCPLAESHCFPGPQSRVRGALWPLSLCSKTLPPMAASLACGGQLSWRSFSSSYSLGLGQVDWHLPTVVVFHGASVGMSCLPGLCCRVGETSACHTSPPDVGSITSLFLFVLLVFVFLFFLGQLLTWLCFGLIYRCN